MCHIGRVQHDPVDLTAGACRCFAQVLIDWINDVLVGERIIVKDLAEDLYDGQVLQKLFGEKRTSDAKPCSHTHTTTTWLAGQSVPFTSLLYSPHLCWSTEKLEGEKLNVAEVTQSEIAQKQKLQTVLERINDSLKLSTRSIRWNVDCKTRRDLTATLQAFQVKVYICIMCHFYLVWVCSSQVNSEAQLLKLQIRSNDWHTFKKTGQINK